MFLIPSHSHSLWIILLRLFLPLLLPLLKSEDYDFYFCRKRRPQTANCAVPRTFAWGLTPSCSLHPAHIRTPRPAGWHLCHLRTEQASKQTSQLGNYCQHGRHVVSNIEVDIEITRWSLPVKWTLRQRKTGGERGPSPPRHSRLIVQMYRKL